MPLMPGGQACSHRRTLRSKTRRAGVGLAGQACYACGKSRSTKGSVVFYSNTMEPATARVVRLRLRRCSSQATNLCVVRITGHPSHTSHRHEPAAACLRDDATSMSRIESPPCTAAPCLAPTMAPTLGSWANRSCRVIPGGCFEQPSLRPACDVARWLLVVVWVALRVVGVVWHDGERWSGVVHGGPGARAGERGRR